MAKKEPEAVTLKQITESINSRLGANTMTLGSGIMPDPPRIPTGVFVIDLALAGGIPLHGTTCFWGGDASGKTNLCIDVMYSAQNLCWRCFKHEPLCECSQNSMPMNVFFADPEGTLDRIWAERRGVDPERYVYALADYAEQYIDIAEHALRADDCGLVILDSLATLIPAAEMEDGTEKQTMGKFPAMVTRAVRKLKQRLIRERKRGHPCSVVFTNQLRMKMSSGIQFGSPDTMAGGEAMKHEFSLVIRSRSKTLKSGDEAAADKKYRDESRSIDMAQRHSFQITKKKIFTLMAAGEYVRILEDIPELKLKAGQIDDRNLLWKWAKDYGLVRGDSKVGFYYGKKRYAKQKDLAQDVLGDESKALVFKRAIIDKIKHDTMNKYAKEGEDGD